MTPEQGDIVLVPVPFTDVSSSVRRPVVVISTDDYHRTTADFVAVSMTSNLRTDRYSFVLTQADLAEGTLNHPGRVRVDRVYNLAQSRIVNKFGKVDAATLDRIRAILADLVR